LTTVPNPSKRSFPSFPKALLPVTTGGCAICNELGRRLGTVLGDELGRRLGTVLCDELERSLGNVDGCIVTEGMPLGDSVLHAN